MSHSCTSRRAFPAGLITKRQVAEILCVSLSTVDRLIRAGVVRRAQQVIRKKPLLFWEHEIRNLYGALSATNRILTAEEIHALSGKGRA